MNQNPSEHLTQVRDEIDRIDTQIVRLIAERGQQVALAGALKSSTSDVPAPDRVETVISRVRELASSDGTDPDLVETVYRTMIDQFIERELQQVKQARTKNDAR